MTFWFNGDFIMEAIFAPFIVIITQETIILLQAFIDSFSCLIGFIAVSLIFLFFLCFVCRKDFATTRIVQIQIAFV